MLQRLNSHPGNPSRRLCGGLRKGCALAICVGIALCVSAGCASSRSGDGADASQVGSPHGKKKPRRPSIRAKDRIRSVRCLYDQSPWFSADSKGDRDYEGIQYRVFLTKSSDRRFLKGITREGTFHVELYKITRGAGGSVERELASDWHYPASVFAIIESKILGRGYHLKLRWASKSLSGHEIDMVTEYEDVDGRRVRAATKRFRIPRIEDAKTVSHQDGL